MTWLSCSEDGCGYSCPATRFNAGLRTHTARFHGRKPTRLELDPDYAAPVYDTPPPQAVRHHYRRSGHIVTSEPT